MTDSAVSTQFDPVDVRVADLRRATPAAVSFRALFESEFAFVWRTLRRLGVAERDLEDTVHDMFVLVHDRLGEYDPRRPLRPWLFGIAYRMASDYRRLARHRRELLDDRPTEPADGQPGADERLEAEEVRRIVLDALEALDLDKRAVVVLHDLEGHAIPEVAAALGIPLNTAYSRLRLGRAECKAAVLRLQAKERRHSR